MRGAEVYTVGADPVLKHHRQELLARSHSHNSDGKYVDQLRSNIAAELKKSQSFNMERGQKKKKSNLPETALDIHRLIFESDARIKEMIEEAKKDDDEEEDVIGDAVVKREFECNHCGSRNVVRGCRTSGDEVIEMSDKRASAPEGRTKTSGLRSGMAGLARTSGSRFQQQRRRLFRSKSRARFLNSAEQAKLVHFRRYLQGSGIGYHELIERVDRIRTRQDEDRNQAVDEDGFSVKRKSKVKR